MLAAWWNPLDWAKGAIGWLGDKITDAASGLLGQIFEWIAGMLIRGIVWLFAVILGFVSEWTVPDLDAAWFTDGPLAVAKAIAAFLIVLFVILAIAEAVWNRDGGQLLRATAQDLPRAMFLIVTLTFATGLAVATADEFSQRSIELFADNIEAIPATLSEVSHGLVFGTGTLVINLIALFLMLTLLFVAFELVVREALIYLLVVITAVLLTTEIYRPTKGMGGRALRLLGVVVATKPLIAVCLAVGGAAIGQHAGEVADDAGHAAAAEPAAEPWGGVDAAMVSFWKTAQRADAIPEQYLIEQNCIPTEAEVATPASCAPLQFVDGVVRRSDGTAAVTAEGAAEAALDAETAAVGPTFGLILAGSAVMIMAAFSPFLLIRLISMDPAADSHAWRRGITGPVRSGVTTVSSVATGGGGAVVGAAAGGAGRVAGRGGGGSSGLGAAANKAG